MFANDAPPAAVHAEGMLDDEAHMKLSFPFLLLKSTTNMLEIGCGITGLVDVCLFLPSTP